MEKKELIGKGRIKKGGNCGQDFEYFLWPRPTDEEDTEFTFYEARLENRLRAEAVGYGDLSKPDSYGNGAIYVKIEDIVLNRIVEGTWPADDIRRVFVAGAKWWEFHSTGGTMWNSDRSLAEEEAEKRYPDGKFANI